MLNPPSNGFTGSYFHSTSGDNPTPRARQGAKPPGKRPPRDGALGILFARYSKVGAGKLTVGPERIEFLLEKDDEANGTLRDKLKGLAMSTIMNYKSLFMNGMSAKRQARILRAYEGEIRRLEESGGSDEEEPSDPIVKGVQNPSLDRRTCDRNPVQKAAMGILFARYSRMSKEAIARVSNLETKAYKNSNNASGRIEALLKADDTLRDKLVPSLSTSTLVGYYSGFVNAMTQKKFKGVLRGYQGELRRIDLEGGVDEEGCSEEDEGSDWQGEGSASSGR